MSYGFGFGTALRGLNASRLSMEIIGQNVSNVNTPGYTRQRVLLGSTLPTRHGSNNFFVGTGVQVDTVHRILDERLTSRIRAQQSLQGFAEVEYRRANEIEGIIGEPGEGALSGLFNSWFDSVSTLRGDASSRALRGNVVQSAQELTSGFNLLATRLGSLDNDSSLEVQGYVQEVNDLAAEIADLNKNIVTLEVGSHPVNDLRDRRDYAIEQLAGLLDTRAIPRENGSIDVLAGGFLVVSGSRSTDLRTVTDDDGRPTLKIGASDATIRPSGGKIAALMQGEDASLLALRSNLDSLARNFALEVNRIHSTGMPKGGPFTSLVAENGIEDANGNGAFEDELLGFGGLPFDVQDGKLYVAVTHLESGDVERTAIDINANTTTLGDVANALSAISNVSANVDPTGRLRIRSSDGYGFDFSRRLDANPNAAGTMGGANATLGSRVTGPFALGALPASFQIQVDGGSNETINLDGIDFDSPSDISAKELVEVLNAKFDAGSIAARAVAVGGGIALQSTSPGSTSALRLTDGTGTPLSALGLPSGVTASGQSRDLAISVSGEYNGDGNDVYRFVAEGDGQIGVTEGLTIGVYDENGTKIASVAVGADYSPLDRIDIGDGIEIAIGPGSISNSTGDSFALDVLDDPDTADVLTSLGLNTILTGSNASDLAVADRLVADPDLLAAGLSLTGSIASQGDAGNIRILEGLRDSNLEAFAGDTIEGFWNAIARDVGFGARASETVLKSQTALADTLKNQRESTSGVDIDEEMIDLERFQQAYQASARYLNIMTEVSDVLLSLGA